MSEVHQVDPARPEDFGPAVEAAADALRRGFLVVFPTDTVYGIAGLPDDPSAMTRLFEAKRRPADLSLPVLAATVEDAWQLGVRNRLADALAEAFWPGPLTLVLPRSPRSSPWSLGGSGDTLGVRVPAHPLTLALLERVGPLATTSANISGLPPLSDPAALASTFGSAVAVYLVEPASAQRLEAPSTVVDLSGKGVRIIRRGAVDEDRLLAVVRRAEGPVDRLRPVARILLVCTGNICRSPIAEGTIRHLLAERGIHDVTVRSAGVSGWEGSPAVPEAVQALKERGIDISSHMARRLTPSMVQAVDLVVALAAEHRDAVERIAPEAAGRTFTLKELVSLLDDRPETRGADPGERLKALVRAADTLRSSRDSQYGIDEDVADPLGLGIEAFRATAWELGSLSERLVDLLFEGGPEHQAAGAPGAGQATKGGAG